MICALRYTFIALAGFLFFSTASAVAQEQTAAPGSGMGGPKPLIMLDEDEKAPAKTKEAQLQEALNMLSQLPPPAQTEVTQESTKVKNYCDKNHLLSNFYDCSCLSLKFIKERIQTGPEPEFTRLIDTGDFDVCVAPPQIAGYSYKRCYDVIFLEKMTDKDVENACGCVARNMARSYTLTPRRNIRYIDRMFSSNMLRCRQNPI